MNEEARDNAKLFGILLIIALLSILIVLCVTCTHDQNEKEERNELIDDLDDYGGSVYFNVATGSYSLLRYYEVHEQDRVYEKDGDIQVIRQSWDSSVQKFTTNVTYIPSDNISYIIINQHNEGARS